MADVSVAMAQGVPGDITNSERELLLLCGRGGDRSDRLGHVRSLLTREIDLARLIRVAQWNGILPLLCSTLASSGPGTLSPQISEELRRRLEENAMRNLALTRELLQLLDVFSAHGIAAIPFKGPILAWSAYGNLAFRRFDDLDILVKKNDVRRAAELLLAGGYRLESQLPWDYAEQLIQWNFELAFSPPDGGGHLVEIHWEILPQEFPWQSGVLDLWAESRPVRIGSRNIEGLSSENLLLFLCAHGAKHLWNRLSWICDVARLIETSGAMNWTQVADRARRLRCERMLHLGLSLAHDLLGANPPEEFLQKTRADAALMLLVSQVQKQLFRDAKYEPTTFESCRFWLAVADRWPDGLRLCLNVVLVPKEADFAVVRLPKMLSFLYYPLRAGRLGVRYAMSLVRGTDKTEGSGIKQPKPE